MLLPPSSTLGKYFKSSIGSINVFMMVYFSMPSCYCTSRCAFVRRTKGLLMVKIDPLQWVKVWSPTFNHGVIQGDPNQNFPFQIAIPLKLSSSDPMLVKPKCV